MDAILGTSTVASATSTPPLAEEAHSGDLAERFAVALGRNHQPGTLGGTAYAHLRLCADGGDGAGRGTVVPTAAPVKANSFPTAAGGRKKKDPSGTVAELKGLQEELVGLRKRLKMKPVEAVAAALRSEIAELEKQMATLRLQRKPPNSERSSKLKTPELGERGSEGEAGEDSERSAGSWRRQLNRIRRQRRCAKKLKQQAGDVLGLAPDAPAATAAAMRRLLEVVALPQPIKPAVVTSVPRPAEKELCWLCQWVEVTATFLNGEKVCPACAKAGLADRIVVACEGCQGTVCLTKEIVLAARQEGTPVLCRTCREKAAKPVVETKKAAPVVDPPPAGTVTCFVCGELASPGPRLTWKSPKNEVRPELKAIVAADRDGRVCQPCLMPVLHVADLPTGAQPATLEGLRVYVAKNKTEVAARKTT